MASTAELLVKVLADTSSAVTSLRSAAEGIKSMEGATATAASTTTKSHGIFSRFGEELGSIGKIAAGMATGMLAANVTMGIAERFKDAAEQIEVFGSATRKVQLVTGDTAENSSRLVAVFQRFGMTGDEAASKISRFERALLGQESALELSQTGGKKGADILRELGVRTQDATGKSLPFSQVLLNLADRWKDLDAASRNAAARSLFGGLGGSGGEQMNRMLSQGREGLQQVIAMADKYGLTLTQENLDDVKKFGLAHKDMNMALQGVSLQLGASLMPAVTQMAQVMVRVAQAINEAVMPALRALPVAIPIISALIGGTLVVAIASATIAMGRFAVAGIAQTVTSLVKLAAPMAALIARYAAVAAAAAAAAAAQVAAWLAAAGPITLIIGGIALAAGAIALALSGKLGEAKDAIGAGIAQIGEAVKNGWDTIAKLTEPIAHAAGEDAGTAFGEGTEEAIESSGVKAAKAAKAAADNALKGIQDATTTRKLSFELANVDTERSALTTKLDQTQAEAELIPLKQQMEDLDANSVNYARKRLELDQEDAITKAKIAESTLKANNEDLTYQERLIKAQLLASRHGGPAMDRSAARAELRNLHTQELLGAPGLLAAEHNVTLANRAKEQTDLTSSLGKTDLERQKLAIQEAMRPFEAAVTFAKRVAEDAQRSLDLAKQNFAIWETYYEKDRLRAEIAAKEADAALVAAQAPAPVTVNVTVNNSGASGADPDEITGAVLAGVTQAAQDAKKSGPMVIAPHLGGGRYAAA